MDVQQRRFTLSQTFGRGNRNTIVPIVSTTTGDVSLSFSRDLSGNGRVTTTFKPDDSVAVQWSDGDWDATIRAPLEGWFWKGGGSGVKVSMKRNVGVSLYWSLTPMVVIQYIMQIKEMPLFEWKIESNCVTGIEELSFFNAIITNTKIQIMPSQLESSLCVLVRKKVYHRLYHYLIAIDRIKIGRRRKIGTEQRRRRRPPFERFEVEQQLPREQRKKDVFFFASRLRCLGEKQSSGSIHVSMFRNRWRLLNLLVHPRYEGQ